MSDGRGADVLEIKRKRAASSLSNLKKKADAGEMHGKERALMRIGKQQTKLMTGQEDLSGWDDEELAAGRRRDKRGGLAGNQPKVVAKVLYDELIRRTLSTAHEMMRKDLVGAVALLGTIVRDDKAENKDRLKAAGMIIDRVMGKEPIKVDVEVQAKWEGALVNVMHRLEAAIDVDSSEDDDEDEEDPFS